MSQETFNPIQKELREIATTIVFKPKSQRQVLIMQMNALIRQLSAEQLIAVIQSINEAPALRFLVPAGTFGSARDVLFNKIARLAERRAE